MNADKFYTVKKTINGIEYTAQYNGNGVALEANDRCYIPGTNTISQVKWCKYLLENVLVEPKGLTADDFDSLEELSDVLAFLGEVMQGKFRSAKEQGTAKARSKG